MIFHYIKYLYNCFIGYSIGLLLNDFFNRQFPNEHKIFTNHVTNLFVNVSYNCIYFVFFAIYTCLYDIQLQYQMDFH